ncbi:MAG: MBOAT family protein, partial [Gammaproteobacteria bacterium]
MLFNSDIFLFVFLPLTLIGYYMLGRGGFTRAAICLLIVASLIYYAWWNPAYLPLILGSMLVNYLLGRLINGEPPSKSFLTLGVIFNLGLLGYFKY